LRNNGSFSIVPWVFVAAGMNLYSDFTIPAFGRHVTTDYAMVPSIHMLSISSSSFCGWLFDCAVCVEPVALNDVKI
jgi:hypothetical protein